MNTYQGNNPKLGSTLQPSHPSARSEALSCDRQNRSLHREVRHVDLTPDVAAVVSDLERSLFCLSIMKGHDQTSIWDLLVYRGTFYLFIYFFNVLSLESSIY